MASATSTSLWPVIECSSSRTTLPKLAYEKHAVGETSGIPRYVLGLNASAWVRASQLQYSAADAHAAQQPELVASFCCLAQLLHAPVVPLFVFDARAHSEEGHGKLFARRGRPLERGLRDLISAFGFPWYIAPGNADAELARLNAEHLVDAVVSEDARPVLFGAQTIICSINKSFFGREIVVYEVPKASCSSPFALSRGGFLLYHLLRLDSKQLIRRPFHTALASVLAGTHLGDALLNVALTQHGKDLRHALFGWREDLCGVLRLNTEGKLDRQYPAMAASLPATFPSVSFIEQYIAPLTSWSHGTPPGAGAVQLCKPDLRLLTIRCEQLFGWDSSETLGEHFRLQVWPGLFLRAIQLQAFTPHAHESLAAIKVTAQRMAVPRSRGAELRVFFDAGGYADISASALRRLHPVASAPIVPITGMDDDNPDGGSDDDDSDDDGDNNNDGDNSSDDDGGDDESDDDSASSTSQVRAIWVPAMPLKRACPELVAKFESL